MSSPKIITDSFPDDYGYDRIEDVMEDDQEDISDD